MSKWLSNNYDVSINAVILKYIKTKNGDELIARTVIIPEEIEKRKEVRKSDFNFQCQTSLEIMILKNLGIY